MHLSCEIGSKILVEFLVEKAKEMSILKFIINAKDELNYTPLYKLCLKGYKGKYNPLRRPKGHK